METCKEIEQLNLRDFLRVYLFVNARYTTLKQENPANIASALYAILKQ